MGGFPTTPFQYVDARDLADFVLTCAQTGRPGEYDVVTPAGKYTWGDLANAVAEVAGGKPVFVEDDVLIEAGVEQWRGLPMWVPQTEQLPGLWAVDGSAAREFGFDDRPLVQTVADTWTWLQKQGADWAPTARMSVTGVRPEVEEMLLRSAVT